MDDEPWMKTTAHRTLCIKIERINHYLTEHLQPDAEIAS